MYLDDLPHRNVEYSILKPLKREITVWRVGGSASGQEYAPGHSSEGKKVFPKL